MLFIIFIFLCRHGIFNVRSDLSVCCAYKGEQALTSLWKLQLA